MVKSMVRSMLCLFALVMIVGVLGGAVKNNGWLQGEVYNEHTFNTDQPEDVIKQREKELDELIAAVVEGYKQRGALDRRERGTTIPEEEQTHTTNCEFINSN